MEAKNRSTYDYWLIPLCFVAIYFIWGSTYVAIAFSLESLPPYLLAAIRFLVAGVLISIYALATGQAQATKKQLINTLISGFLFFTIGNGLVVWGIQYVESGLASLIIALQPMNVALLLWWMNGERPKLLVWIGLLIGILGMALLVGQPTYINNTNWMLGLGAILIAIMAWGVMSIKLSEINMPKSILFSSGLQMIFGSFVLFIIAAFRYEFAEVVIPQISTKSILAMIYLIIFGSIVAFTAFNYLLIKVSPTRVATSAYINPVVALFLGWWLNNEHLSPRSLFACALLLAGVVLINLSKRRKKTV